MKQWTTATWLLLALPLSGASVLVVLWFMALAPRWTTADPGNANMATSDDRRAPEEAVPKVRVFSSHYDEHCGLLSLRVYFENPGTQPVYFVSHDFAFVHGHPVGVGHQLVCHVSEDKLLLDLSHTKPTADGYQYFRSEEGTYGFEPEVIEIRPSRFRYITYAFQFPLRLDHRVSEVEQVSRPEGMRKVQLRLGYSHEPFSAFSEREFRQAYTIEEWQQRIVTGWQNHIETDPASVQFSDSAEPGR